ncbi:MAG: hypothetical protein LQ351_007984 [Letrouitia transgressa]|nr:MAG: hypothetical protein LQ351_007984 [Letrouitia transgressa]
MNPDPLLAVVPDDFGKDIKKRMIDGDGSDSEEPAKKRARANTDSLLPPEDPSEPDGDVLDPPEPEDDLEKYTTERLQKGLKYIKKAEKRDITPRTRVYLEFYKDAYKDALERTSLESASRAVVQKMDEVYRSSALYFKVESAEKHEYNMLLVEVRKLELLICYGDYLGQELQKFRADLTKEVKKGYSSEVKKAHARLGGNKLWTSVADEIEGKAPTNIPEHMDIACVVLGLDSDYMSWIVSEYAKRNRKFHNQVRVYIEKCEWTKLGEQICRDINELPNLITSKDEYDKYITVLSNIRDRYFEVKDPYNVKFWHANARAKKEQDDLLAMKEKAP